MARINPNTNRTSRLSLLEAGETRAPNEEEKEETNPLGVINTLLALRELKDLIGWLGSNTEENSTKLIKFIVAVRDEYDELVVDYNQLQNERNDELLASKDGDNTQNKALAEKQGVIRYLQGQVADFTAENNTFRRLQEQAMVNPPIVGPPGNNETSGIMDHEPSPGPSTDSTNTSTKKRRLKLQDPDKFTNGKDGDPVEYWLAQMRSKMAADDDLYDTPARRMVYVMNRVGSEAFGHLEPRARVNASRPWKDSDEMLAYLERVFGDPNRRANAETQFCALRQGSKDFNTFWAEFQRLSIELDQNDATLISNLTSKLSYEMQRQLSTGDEEPTDLLKYVERCQRVAQRLKDAARTKAASEQYNEKRAAAASVSSTPAAKKVATSTTTTQTTSSLAEPSCRLSIGKRDWLMKEAKCFTCKQVGHRTTKCSND